MNTENDIKEFGFRHISINTVYNVLINAPSPEPQRHDARRRHEEDEACGREKPAGIAEIHLNAIEYIITVIVNKIIVFSPHSFLLVNPYCQIARMNIRQIDNSIYS